MQKYHKRRNEKFPDSCALVFEDFAKNYTFVVHDEVEWMKHINEDPKKSLPTTPEFKHFSDWCAALYKNYRNIGINVQKLQEFLH